MCICDGFTLITALAILLVNWFNFNLGFIYIDCVDVHWKLFSSHSSAPLLYDATLSLPERGETGVWD